MKSFWDKAIEKHRKGKGIKARTNRGPKIKASAIYGGMGEREIQLRLEIHLEGFLSTKKSVLNPAKDLCKFNMQDQERFIETVGNICDTDMELAYSFCHNGVESLKHLDESQWDNWIAEIAKNFKDGGLDKSIQLMNDIVYYSNSLAGTASSIDFSEFSKTIESLLTGLNGRPLKVEVAEEIYTDTETIYLPERVSSEKTKEENFHLIKASAIHLWAQTYFGTWRVNKEDFNEFEDKEKAIKAYHLLETIRLDEKIKKELPGVGRILDKLNSKTQLKSISKNFDNAVNALSDQKSTYKESLNLISSIINDIDKVPSSQYAGNLKLDSASLVADERINQDKINFEKALEELHEQWKEVEKAPEESSENENSNEKNFLGFKRK